MNMRTMAFAVALTLAQSAVWADGVTRSLEPVVGGDGCKVTLAWTFSGKVDSDLVIEECFAPGWSVDGSTVSFDDTIVTFDAKWISGPVARFAVLGAAGSISFIVRSQSAATSVSVKGEWQMYMDGSLRRGMVAGAEELSNLCASSGKQSSETAETSLVEVPVAIKSFRVLDASRIELTYGGLPKTGTLVVQGCEGLGKTWMEVKRAAVSTPDGTVTLEPKDCRFYRMKLLTEEE